MHSIQPDLPRPLHTVQTHVTHVCGMKTADYCFGAGPSMAHHLDFESNCCCRRAHQQSSDEAIEKSLALAWLAGPRRHCNALLFARYEVPWCTRAPSGCQHHSIGPGALMLSEKGPEGHTSHVRLMFYAILSRPSIVLSGSCRGILEHRASCSLACQP